MTGSDTWSAPNFFQKKALHSKTTIATMVIVRWDGRREQEMLIDVVTTEMPNLWYEIWQTVQDDAYVYTAYRLDMELGHSRTVATKWKESHARRAIRNDMISIMAL